MDPHIRPVTLKPEVFNLVKVFFHKVQEHKKIEDYFLADGALSFKETVKEKTGVDFISLIMQKDKFTALKMAWNRINNYDYLDPEEPLPAEGYLKALDIYLSIDPALAELMPPSLRAKENAELMAPRYPALAKYYY
jgi:hypothetical protein